MRPLFLAAALLAFTLAPLDAKVVTKSISYKDGDVDLEGHLAWDDAVAGKRPGVLVVHEWWGLNDYARGRAEQLAALGYATFAIDMYGKGKLAKHPDEARAFAGEIRKSVDGWRKRALAALEVFKQQPVVDATRLASMGYCFGGGTSLQLAYLGTADLKAVVSFHGALPAYDPAIGKPITAKILICHGADDPFIPEEQVKAFQKAMNDAKADWHMVNYGGARHSFTVPGADKIGIDGMRYSESADKRSWAHMERFLKEAFADAK